jgi:predicted DNA-binding transcriptional regulator YafY
MTLIIWDIKATGSSTWLSHHDRTEKMIMRAMGRLFLIILLLRRGRVITAHEIAQQINVSQRTVYRDLKSLIESGVPIEGEAGVGYSLRKEFYLPPLMFTESELRALAAGAKTVYITGDVDLVKAHHYALAKIEASLPPHLRTLLCSHNDGTALSLQALPKPA